MHEKLKEVLAQRGISYAELARQTGISQPDMSCAVRGTKPMYPKYKRLICEYLDMSEKDLFK